MNTFGVDAQGLFSRIAVCEVNGEVKRLGNVSDGKRYAIPTFVQNGQWGTNALTTESALFNWWTAATEVGGSPNYNQVDFWRELYNHLYRYLGWIEPCVTNGYNLAVGLSHPTDSLTSRSGHLKNVLEQAGFDSPVFIPATHCLLTKWLATKPSVQKAKFITALAINDESASLQTYELIPQHVGLQIHCVGNVIILNSVKPIEWVKLLMNQANTQLFPEIEPLSRLTLLDFSLDYSRQLRNVETDRIIRQKRQINAHTVEFCYSSDELSERPEFRWPVTQVVEAIRKATQLEYSAKSLLLIGGSGAIWPFFEQALNQDYSLWQSSDPSLDIAHGAALFGKLPGLVWTDLVNPTDSILKDHAAKESPSKLVSGTSSNTTGTSQRPPWAQRGEGE